MSINPNDPIVDFVQQLLDSARLASPVTLDGQEMNSTNTNPGGGTQPPIPTYDNAGWGLEVTALGGRRSKGLDALRKELIDLGQEDLAKEIPEYVISRWWAAPCAYGFAVQDNRFSKPNTFGNVTVSDDIWNQAVRNLNMEQNDEFAQAMTDSHAKSQWRGQADGRSFAPINMAVYNAQAGTLAQSGLTPIEFVAESPTIRTIRWPRKFLVNSTDVRHYYDFDSEASKAYRNHTVVSVFVDCQTDAAFTRMWRSFAKAVGGRNQV